MRICPACHTRMTDYYGPSGIWRLEWPAGANWPTKDQIEHTPERCAEKSGMKAVMVYLREIVNEEKRRHRRNRDLCSVSPISILAGNALKEYENRKG